MPISITDTIVQGFAFTNNFVIIDLLERRAMNFYSC